jgi:hypothetical protein
MASCTSKDYSKRNVCIKVVISALIALGIFCAIFAICSCRWFVFLQDESSENRLFQDWSFLPEKDMDTTISIGIFRYQTTSIDEAYDDDESSNATTTSTPATAGNEAYISISNDQCVSYPGFWVGTDYRWKFTAQLCSVLGTIIAFVSWCVIMVGADRFWICIFLLLATGVQSATIISSLSWCDQYWNCPWLLGALINLVAACLFLSSWVLAMWGLVEIRTTNSSSNTNSNSNTNVRQKQKGKQKQPNPDLDSKNESTDAGESYPSTVIVMNNNKTGSRNEEMTCTAGETDSQTMDLESGPNTIALYRTSDQLSHDSKTHIFESFSSDDDGKCSITDKELYYDASFDDDTKSTMKRISQSNQTFLDLDAKLKERRENAAHDTVSSDTSVDNGASCDDSSSTNTDE